jgi:hypothetical protein
LHCTWLQSLAGYKQSNSLGPIMKMNGYEYDTRGL